MANQREKIVNQNNKQNQPYLTKERWRYDNCSTRDAHRCGNQSAG